MPLDHACPDSSQPQAGEARDRQAREGAVPPIPAFLSADARACALGVTLCPDSLIEIAIFGHFHMGDCPVVDLVWAVCQTQRAFVSPGAGQSEVVADPSAAVGLEDRKSVV